jgi:hypothetical protein
VVTRAGSSSLPSLEERLEGDSASAKARRLLCEILPEKARTEFLATGSFHFEGNGVTYRISERSQTEICTDGRPSATACLQLSVPAPGCDRVIAEYLILKNDERLYWRVANVLPLHYKRVDPRLLLILMLDLALFGILVWDLCKFIM